MCLSFQSFALLLYSAQLLTHALCSIFLSPLFDWVYPPPVLTLVWWPTTVGFEPACSDVALITSSNPPLSFSCLSGCANFGLCDFLSPSCTSIVAATYRFLFFVHPRFHRWIFTALPCLFLLRQRWLSFCAFSYAAPVVSTSLLSRRSEFPSSFFHEHLVFIFPHVVLCHRSSGGIDSVRGIIAVLSCFGISSHGTCHLYALSSHLLVPTWAALTSIMSSAVFPALRASTSLL